MDKHHIPLTPQHEEDLQCKKADMLYAQEASEWPTYPTFVETLFKNLDTVSATLHHATTGMSGEAGELLDMTKKVWANGKPLDVEHMVEELGDLRFYYQAALNLLGLSDEHIQAHNMHKLRARYPGGMYSDELAQKRLDKNPGA